METEQKEKRPVFKRRAKDSVFTHLFSEPKYLLELYKTLHPEDTEATEADISDVTIQNVITDNMYNDLGFFVRDTLVILLEAQSTWSPNIVIRVLLYLAQTYNNYFTKNDIDLYANSKVKLPKPELYVIYTGERKDKKAELSLSEEFFNGAKNVQLDVKVKMLYGGARDIISQYVDFAKVCNDQVQKYGYSRKAIEEILRICIDKDVLAEYLKTREVEIMDIMTALFDEDEVARRYYLRVHRELLQEGMQKGMQRGIQKGMQQGVQKGQSVFVRKMLAKGHTFSEIADLTGYTESQLRSFVQ
mgnify:CR=1 FL=1